MAQKVFVSYKYADSSVASLNSFGWSYEQTTVRKYVDEFIEIAKRKGIVVYKGEMDGEDLSDFSNDYIWSTLKSRIYDSSLTIVFISPNMKVSYLPEREQWIPQEVSYSLKEISHNGITSRSNALLYVVLPDKSNSTYYRATMNQFEIIKRNEENGYAYVVSWNNFKGNMEYYMREANDRASHYTPVKQV